MLEDPNNHIFSSMGMNGDNIGYIPNPEKKNVWVTLTLECCIKIKST